MRDRPKIVGVINCTPDSFYDGGRCLRPQDALAHAERLAREGADLLDFGGESSRPGSDPVSAEEEIRRVIPAVEAAAKRLSLPISVDTYKPEVAAAALSAGAAIVNDITALRAGGERMARLVAEAGASVVLMHMRGTPKTMQENPVYTDVVGEVRAFLEDRAAFAMRCGIPREKIFVDPGIGFGKTADHNLEILRRLEEIVSIGFPVWIGASRKSFLSAVWERRAPAAAPLPPSERLEGTIAACLWAVSAGASYLRVHDVAALARALSVWSSLQAQGRQREEVTV